MTPKYLIILLLSLLTVIVGVYGWTWVQMQRNEPVPIVIHVHGDYAIVELGKDGKFRILGETEMEGK